MDWNAAIEKNREALKRILAALVAMANFLFCAPAATRASPAELPSPPPCGEVDAKRRVGVAPRQLRPPGGPTTTDLPTRGR